MEAEGRAAGGRAVLRLKDIAGYKLELSAINSQHTVLARDIRSSRALLNTLPMPVWLRADDGAELGEQRSASLPLMRNRKVKFSTARSNFQKAGSASRSPSPSHRERATGHACISLQAESAGLTISSCCRLKA